jgi:hypothetical protein
VSAAEGIGEELDTQTSPAQALRAEAEAKVADIYFVFGLGNFGGGGKFGGIPFLPVPHAYVYANLKGVNKEKDLMLAWKVSAIQHYRML